MTASQGTAPKGAGGGHTALQNARICEKCHATMQPGTPVRWEWVERRRHRCGSGREFSVKRRVAVHAHDCIGERIAKAYAERGIENPEAALAAPSEPQA